MSIPPDRDPDHNLDRDPTAATAGEPERDPAAAATTAGEPERDPAAAVATAGDLDALDRRIAACRACPRLVEWREEQARIKVRRFRDETYWGRPVPGYGDPGARILLIGLAPAAHGGNRTGRVFTGDASGDFLWRAMHAVGLADRAESRRGDDGLVLSGVRVAAAVRCAPPANRPTPNEQATCRPFLVREIELLDGLRVIVALGGLAWDAALRSLAAIGYPIRRPKPAFGHGAEVEIGPYYLIGSYHPSQQNTFTGRLTPPMLERVLGRVIELADRPSGDAGQAVDHDGPHAHHDGPLAHHDGPRADLT